jgi:hypothetical protein
MYKIGDRVKFGEITGIVQYVEGDTVVVWFKDGQIRIFNNKGSLKRGFGWVKAKEVATKNIQKFNVSGKKMIDSKRTYLH